MTEPTIETSSAATLDETLKVCGDAFGGIGAVMSQLGHSQFAVAQAQLALVFEPCFVAAKAWLLASGLPAIL